MIFAYFCLFAALPIPFIDNFAVFCTLLWLLMFFGGAILPSLTGIMLNTVKNNQKTTANSIAYLAFNVFGYLPSPFIYGAITDSGEGGNDRIALAALMYTAFIPVVAFTVSTYFIFKEDIMGWNKQEDKDEAD